MRKKICISIIISCLTTVSLCAQDFQIVKMGYSVSQGSWFNLSLSYTNIESRWGGHLYIGGYGVLGNNETGIDYNYNTKIIYDKQMLTRGSAVTLGPSYRIFDNFPTYLNLGIGLGIRTEEWERYEVYDFKYLSDEYNLIYYEENKMGIAIHAGIGIELNRWLGVETFYDTHTGFGGGITIGLLSN